LTWAFTLERFSPVAFRCHNSNLNHSYPNTSFPHTSGSDEVILFNGKNIRKEIDDEKMMIIL